MRAIYGQNSTLRRVSAFPIREQSIPKRVRRSGHQRRRFYTRHFKIEILGHGRVASQRAKDGAAQA